MLTDLISLDNYCFYNITLAQKLGLECAIYISCLLNYSHQVEKSDYFEIDRKFIENKTTLDTSKQKQLDSVLIQLGFISLHEENKKLIKLDTSILMSIFKDEENSSVKEFLPVKVKRKTKADAIKVELRSYIKSTNSELRDAYSDWIDAVFARQGWMSKKSVISGQELIDTYSNRNLDLALEILNIASIGGYRDIQWAINDYEKKIASTKKINTINLSLNQQTIPKDRCVGISTEIF